MNAARWMLVAAVAQIALTTASAQDIATSTVVATTVTSSMLPAEAPPTNISPEAVVNTTAALPPPSPIGADTVQSLTAVTRTFVNNLERADYEKALWVDSGPLQTAAGIKQTVADARAAGFNTIYAQVRSQGDAYYNSTVVPKATTVASDFDPLATLITEARSGGEAIRVYALLMTLRAGLAAGGQNAGHVAIDHPDWISVIDDGSKDIAGEMWLDPGVIEVQDHLALVVTDLLKNYEVDGIVVDRLRYPELDSQKYTQYRLRTGYSEAAIKRFQQEKNQTGKPDPNNPDWIIWRREQVTATMKKIYDAAKAVKPSATVAVAAVSYGGPPDSISSFRRGAAYSVTLMDWPGFAESGIVDRVALLNYRNAEKSAADIYLWQDFAVAAKFSAKLTVVIGGYLNTPAQTVGAMLDTVMDGRTDGVALYRYKDPFQGTENDNNLTLLKPVTDAAVVNQHLAALNPLIQAPPNTRVPQTALARLHQMAQLLGVAQQSGTAPAVPMPALAGASLPGLPDQAATKMPDLPDATPASPTSALPALPGQTVAQLPGLPQATPGLAPLSTLPQLPSVDAAIQLPSLSGTPVPIPPVIGDQIATVNSMPSLPGAPALPNLPSAPVTDSGTLPALPALPGATPQPIPGGAPADGTVMSALPPALVESSVSAPPVSLPELMSPLNTPAASAAEPSSIGPSAPVPDGSELIGAPSGLPPLLTPVPGIQAMPPMSLGTQPLAPAMTPQTSYGEKLAIPDTWNSRTNFDGSTIAGPGPTSSKIVAPSVLTPAAGQTAPSSQPMMQSVLPVYPAKQIELAEAESAFATPNPERAIYYYQSPRINQTPQVTIIPTPDSRLEVIVLRTGQRFSARILERGAVWKIQLPNGSVMEIPAAKIVTTQSAYVPVPDQGQAAPTPQPGIVESRPSFSE